MTQNSNNYSILVNSCDEYKDAWPMFFYILKKTWNGKLPEVYLNTESENYADNSIDVHVLNSKSIHWGERLLEAVEKIDSKYILFMLEDFYYEKPIKVSEIERCIKLLDVNSNVLSIQLVPAGKMATSDCEQMEEVASGIVRRNIKDAYTIIAGPTLWRKTELLKLTKAKDTPWEWEAFGSCRLRLYGKEVWTWKNWKSDPIFVYDIEHGGAIHRGKWVGYKMRELEEKYNYKLEYGKREIVEDWIEEEKSDIIPRHKRIRSIIRNRTTPFFETLWGLRMRYKGE